MPDWDYHLDDRKADTPWYERRTAIKAVHISDGFTNIGKCAFCDCENLTTVYIPNSVTSIGDSAFWWCNSLTSIHIPYGVASIEFSAFSECKSLTEIRIPNSVTKLDDNVSNRCKKTEKGVYAFPLRWPALQIPLRHFQRHCHLYMNRNQRNKNPLSPGRRPTN